MPSLDDALTLVEQQLQEVAAHLLASDPALLERSSERLRTAMAGLAQARSAPGEMTPALAQRLQDINAHLAAQREGLARLAAATDRQAEVLLPAKADQSTYTQAVGMGSASGAAARIYRSAG